LEGSKGMLEDNQLELVITISKRRGKRMEGFKDILGENQLELVFTESKR